MITHYWAAALQTSQGVSAGKTALTPAPWPPASPDNCISPIQLPQSCDRQQHFNPRLSSCRFCVGERARGCRTAGRFHPKGLQLSANQGMSSVCCTWNKLIKKCGTNCNCWFSSSPHIERWFSKLRCYHRTHY